MRSIRKFLLIAFVTILIPAIVMSVAFALNLNEIGIFICQMIIVAIFVFLFTFFLKKQRQYEEKTVAMVDGSRDLTKLREIRDNRLTYRSKAYATRKILSLDYSENELSNLKKYATKADDMSHYFAAKIDHAEKTDRERYKKKRDAYLNRYEKKLLIFPDFKTNLRTAIKWIILFFITAIIYNIIPNYITDWETLLALTLLGMAFLAIVMIMAILWIIRSLVSYWNKDMF